MEITDPFVVKVIAAHKEEIEKLRQQLAELRCDYHSIDEARIAAEKEFAEYKADHTTRNFRVVELIEQLTTCQQQSKHWEEFCAASRQDHELANETLAKIIDWCRAYPVDVFCEPDWSEAKEKLGSTLLTQVSAANFRHILKGVEQIIIGAQGVAMQGDKP